MPAGAVRRDALTAEFFDGTARGEFLLRRCARCGTFGEPFVQQCPGCESTELDWVPAAGGARVVTWSVVHGRRDADGNVPRTVVTIAELDEGPWWWAEILDADPAAVRAGQRLRICFESPAGQTARETTAARATAEGHEAVPAFRAA